jgi:hypothetical protein
MKQTFPLYILACGFILAGCADVSRKAELVGLLVDLKHDTQAKNVQGEEETANFQKAKAAFSVVKGAPPSLTYDEARRMFGNPVTTFTRGRSIVWAYKPASSDWFRGEKLYLVFDAHGTLISLEYIPS